MVRVMVWVVVTAALVSLFACRAKENDPAGSQSNPGDPNTIVADDHWGAKRVVYAADVGMWDADRTTPGEEQWDRPEPGRVCYKFTYHGGKLVRLETFGTDGMPFQTLKAGQRIEWKYGPHGGLLDETGYTEDGEVDEHDTRRYDAAGRLVEEV